MLDALIGLFDLLVGNFSDLVTSLSGSIFGNL